MTRWHRQWREWPGPWEPWTNRCVVFMCVIIKSYWYFTMKKNTNRCAVRLANYTISFSIILKSRSNFRSTDFVYKYFKLSNCNLNIFYRKLKKNFFFQYQVLTEHGDWCAVFSHIMCDFSFKLVNKWNNQVCNIIMVFISKHIKVLNSPLTLIN